MESPRSAKPEDGLEGKFGSMKTPALRKWAAELGIVLPADADASADGPSASAQEQALRTG
eukprot:COSAG01_NODE_7951_length_2978_cov_2.515109_1_plen_60_part_00